MVEKVQLEIGIVCGLDWRPGGEDPAFQFSVGEIEVVFERVLGESQTARLLQVTERLVAMASSTRTLRRTTQVVQLLRSFEAGLLSERVDPRVHNEFEGTSYEADVAAGRLPVGLHLDPTYFPNFYGEFLEEVRRPLLGAIDIAFDRLAFRCGDPVLPRRDSGLLQFRIGAEGAWFQPPQGFSVRTGIAGQGITFVTRTMVAEVQSWLDNKAELDLAGHSLLSEAFNAVLIYPRAAFLTAFVALETSVKRFLSAEVPEVSWLLENLPSPPIVKLVKEMVVGVATKKQMCAEASLLLELALEIEKLTTLRNSLVHASAPLAQVDAKRHIVTIEKVFWTLQIVADTPGARRSLERAQRRIV